MRKFLFTAAISFSTVLCFSQDLTKFKLYNPEEDAEKSIEKAVDRAKDEKKHVFIQIGGNWCIWCARFDDFVKTDKSIDSLITQNYVVYHLNYSKENKNGELLKRYKFPQRFGFPVFLILDGKGELIHTQDSWFMESGKSYDKDKVKAFFTNWSPGAFDAVKYKDDK